MSRQDANPSSEAQRRLEDLLADDALGNIEPEHADELRAAGLKRNPLHTVVASLTEAVIPTATMPLALQRKIEADAARFVGAPQPMRIDSVRPAPSALPAPWMAWLGWGVAAAASAALVFSLLRDSPAPQVVYRDVVKEIPASAPEAVAPVQARARMLAEDASAIIANWAKGNLPEEVSGDVVWSGEKQSGFMRLANLPALPEGLQYQLWIIDAAREGSAPVDGGVFDVAATGEVVIPFSAKLKVTQPAAFAITIEKTGGVVVSKQEKVAALAKPA